MKHIITITIAITFLLSFYSCRKEIDQVQHDSNFSDVNSNENSQRIYVSSIAGLYAAVNDPDNAGNLIILAPGTYVLNAAFPNGGRLELQDDMSLQ